MAQVKENTLPGGWQRKQDVRGQISIPCDTLMTARSDSKPQHSRARQSRSEETSAHSALHWMLEIPCGVSWKNGCTCGSTTAAAISPPIPPPLNPTCALAHAGAHTGGGICMLGSRLLCAQSRPTSPPYAALVGGGGLWPKGLWPNK